MQKKKSKRRKSIAISTFGLESMAATEPLYQRKFQDGDMMWLADEYRRRCNADPSLTIEAFSARYGVSADELRNYVPELGDGTSRSVILWHGTSKTRAESILREGFRPKKKRSGRTFFTRHRKVARGYAQRRAKVEDDQPAVIMCSIDLNKYDDYECQGTVYVFKADCIASDVVKNVAGLARQSSQKPDKRKDPSAEPVNVAMTFNSERFGIAYWINSYLKLNGSQRIDENHESVGKIKQWLDDQAGSGRFGEVPDDEIIEQARKYLELVGDAHPTTTTTR